jgi:ParB-like chromosome segregation protein Spo0J
LPLNDIDGREPLMRHGSSSWSQVSAEQVTLEIGSLILDGSPRIDGEDRAHTQVLAEVGQVLPPILVHKGTLRVIDGVHRVQAARLRGETMIGALLFDGDPDLAFVYAVRANISHGLPLSLADRQTAAQRIIASHPHWSDRAIAGTTGLSPSTIRGIRERVAGGVAPQAARVGRDGRIRPVSIAEGRQRAARVIADRPDASLREIAAAAGISVGTARDVRRRIHNGDDPVPPRARQLRVPHAVATKPAPGAAASQPVREPTTLLAMLRNDPSLRYSQQGRGLVRWLDAHVVDPGCWSRLVESVPPHSAYVLAELALGCARAWEELAHGVKARVEAP